MRFFDRLKARKKFFEDKKIFLNQGGSITAEYPILYDYLKNAGNYGGHYFHQDLLVAQYIFRSNPRRHIDVGSSIEGFVSHVASFRTIWVYDIRPLNVEGHENIRFIQGDLLAIAPSLNGCCDSLSCLHALEHFGLGRYGDTVDPKGHLKGFKNLLNMLTTGGTLYLSVPVGESAVFFNAHRVFGAIEPLQWHGDALSLVNFDYVDDLGKIRRNQDPYRIPTLKYGCGIYTFCKKS